jgi:isoprenylcysteine carboxyl methyltransferase (ICMT) family protein YpbQ
VPLPKPYLLGIAASIWLDRSRPSALPGPRYLHHLAGWPLAIAGARLIERSWTAATQVKLAHPAQVVTSGPYAVSRNPMYLGWALLLLGVGVVRGSWWMISAVPAAAALVHRDVRGEERTLDDAFGEEFHKYQATVPPTCRADGPLNRSTARSRGGGLPRIGNAHLAHPARDARLSRERLNGFCGRAARPLRSQARALRALGGHRPPYCPGRDCPGVQLLARQTTGVTQSWRQR